METNNIPSVFRIQIGILGSSAIECEFPVSEAAKLDSQRLAKQILAFWGTTFGVVTLDSLNWPESHFEFSGAVSMTTEDDRNASDANVPDDQFPLTEDGLLKVYSVGPVTVLGFGGEDVPSEFNVSHYRLAISELLKANNSSIVAFDVTGVRLVPSGMLGLLVSLTRIPDLPLTVQVFNPSDDLREVLSITKLNRFIEIHEVNVG